MDLVDRLELAGAAIAFLTFGVAMILYELARARASKPILNGGVAAQAYMALYGAMFVLAVTCTAAVIIR
jgi:hypothetical protein